MNIILFTIGFICFLICFIRLEYFLIKKSLEAWKNLYISYKELKKIKEEFKEIIDESEKKSNG